MQAELQLGPTCLRDEGLVIVSLKIGGSGADTHAIAAAWSPPCGTQKHRRNTTDGRSPRTRCPPPAVSRSDPQAVALVGKSVVFKGDLTSSEDMTIDGRVEGSIQLRDHALIVGPDADIRASIVARTRDGVHGAVTGTITARDNVDIRATGSVEGDIYAPRLAIADGAMLLGARRYRSWRGRAEGLTARRHGALAGDGHLPPPDACVLAAGGRRISFCTRQLDVSAA